jgi:hypothetical protein
MCKKPTPFGPFWAYVRIQSFWYSSLTMEEYDAAIATASVFPQARRTPVDSSYLEGGSLYRQGGGFACIVRTAWDCSFSQLNPLLWPGCAGFAQFLRRTAYKTVAPAYPRVATPLDVSPQSSEIVPLYVVKLLRCRTMSAIPGTLR